MLCNKTYLVCYNNIYDVPLSGVDGIATTTSLCTGQYMRVHPAGHMEGTKTATYVRDF